MTTRITITEDHLALLRRAWFDWEDDYEWGGVGQDQKRPFGNSDVQDDISEIIGREVSSYEARQLSIELTGVVRQAIAHALGAAPFGVGIEVDLPWRAARAVSGGTPK